MGADETESADVLAEREAGTKAVLLPMRHEVISSAAENFIVYTLFYLGWIE
jgi:hypothetical protein